jgi:hypothetical protein
LQAAQRFEVVDDLAKIVGKCLSFLMELATRAGEQTSVVG